MLVRDDHVRLPPGHPSLVLGYDGAPGELAALSASAGVAAAPADGQVVRFGRNRPRVDVPVGDDDRRVSREQGLLTFRDGGWWVSNTGNLPLRLPTGRLARGAQARLSPGYTPLSVRGSGVREYLLELFVVGSGEPAAPWPLTPDERLAVVVLCQRYLRHKAYAQVLTIRQAVTELNALRPGEWTAPRLTELVEAVHERLVRVGALEPVADHPPEHAVLQELMWTNSVVPEDLTLLDTPPRRRWGRR